MTRRKQGDIDEISGTIVIRSSGNVFADLDLTDAEERLAKAKLAHAVAALVANTTQKEAAVLLGVDQPKVSALLRGRLEQFSTERLMGFLTRLGQTVEIHVKPAAKKKSRGRLLVVSHV